MIAVSSIGAFGSNEFMEKVCGDANIATAEAAKAADIENFVFVSAAPADQAPPPVLLTGYIKGKAKAEEAIMQQYVLALSTV